MPENYTKDILKLENITKSYQMGDDVEVTALSNLNLTIKQNDFISILGPSGSGKSTLLHMMGLLDTPTSGKRYVDEIDTTTMSEDDMARIRGKKIGFVFQTFNLISSLTALENVELPMLLCDQNSDQRKEKAMELMGLVGLSDRLDHLPGQLSGGQRQRVAIARALANDPEIILADEPTGNLDSKTGSEVLGIFRSLHKKGKTIIVITHDQSIAKMTDRIVRLKDGKII
ncbi:ABC transporter ATP-binding protein [Candidatus Micrarchaeota archaeon]|nr:ABC transporter ATP-binding protein [Candidatus Micrarchaeota archaeon]MBU1165911.1 ABC transporter ATP-binding protein [Candidatus Micrarchaeota archaeon]MBU1886790.1 ABC transporter ATP-binding protein [Candidatus Micrarchaeota archaeon]